MGEEKETETSKFYGNFLSSTFKSTKKNRKKINQFGQ